MSRRFRGCGQPRLEEVSDNIFAYIQPDGTWWINNAGLVVGRTTAVIDACSTETRSRAYLAAIRRVTRKPVRTLVNTHHHGDHTFGNFVFEHATIVGHERTRSEMLAAGWPPPDGIWEPVEWGRIEITPPFLTFTNEVTFYVDELQCIVRHVGRPAQTTNDSIVWIPERSVLFAGDLVFNEGTPFLLNGSVKGSLDVIDQLKGYGAKIVIPGHGAPCGPEIFDQTLDYLRFVMHLAEQGMAAGLSPLETARQADLGAWVCLLDSERIVGNLARAYADLDTSGSRGNVDVVAALRAMVEYNGGHPLTCHA